VAARATRLYGALSQDLDTAAQRADTTGQGFAAHKNASRIYSNIQDQRDNLTSLIGKQGDKAPEQVFAGLLSRASGTPSRADIALLQQAKNNVLASSTPQAWDTFERGVINQLGVGKTGWTPDMYLNHWNGIAKDAKDVLFSPANRAKLEDAATVAQKMKEAGFAKNPSGTGHAVGAMGLLASAPEWAPWLWHHPVAGTAGLAAGAGAGRLLTAPVTGPVSAGAAARNYIAQQLARRGLTTAGGQFGVGQGQAMQGGQ
jgi:hypothetical protein